MINDSRSADWKKASAGWRKPRAFDTAQAFGVTRFPSLVASGIVICLLAGCDGAVDDVSAREDRAETASGVPEATAPVSEFASLNADLLGTWAPYDDVSKEQLGEADIGEDFLRFDRGSMLQLIPRTPAAAEIMINPRVKVCGKSPAVFVTFRLVDHPRPRSLKIAFYDQRPEPTAEPDFDSHRCQVFTYVRD